MIELRIKHDSQVDSQKGNELKKGMQSTAKDLSDGVHVKLDPRVCSKVVSIIVKGGVSLDKAVARTHRWNISVNLDLRKISTNTSTRLTLSDQAFYKCGEISEVNPLENGKFVVIIKNKVT